MTGVNLIDFTMPSAVPASAGGGVRNVGGMRLILPKKAEAEEKKPAEEAKKKVNWKLILLLLFAWVMLFKIATWYMRRYGK
ncbi:hypothetical protein [Thermococcus nautili]|uniref:Uncharacterized protein n=1 Tax=Thermococcus nautili TaxID=195522 RepID=U3RLN5_9EURY|nr:hypothetical protein [Thermococcus nautili]AGX15335.1 hypothetical protein TNaP3-21 [Thermococcus nautili]AHL23862.1 hypothetical protein BD01_2275 [Thermococcus nautili]